MHATDAAAPLFFGRAAADHAARGDRRLRQLGTVNQFAAAWAPAMAAHRTAGAICGYLAAATARAAVAANAAAASRAAAGPAVKETIANASRAYLCGTITSAAFHAAAAEAVAAARAAGPARAAMDAEAWRECLGDFAALEPRVVDVMRHVAASRERWLAAHPADFAPPATATAEGYRRAWVANYELSDYLRELPEAAEGRIAFVRYNQWPDLHDARDEERLRLEEERPFGGVMAGPDAPCTFDGDGDSRFIVELFGGSAGRRLLRPEDALRDPGLKDVIAFVVDLSGHFGVAVPHFLPDGERELLLLNTTQNSYLHGAGLLACCLCYDLMFPEAAAAAADAETAATTPAAP